MDMGADLVGFADISRNDNKDAISKEFHHYKIAVAVGKKLHKFKNPEDETRTLDEHGHTLAYMRENEDITLKLKEIVDAATRFLRKRGFKCMAIPPVDVSQERRFISALYVLFSHRMAVTMAGLGWIGKNAMVINGEYGPNLVWATILTDAELTASPPQLESMCGQCRLCQDSCPVGAIYGLNWSRFKGDEAIIDVENCQRYMQTNSDKYGRPVCGICFMACPVGVKKTRKGK